MNKQLKKPMNKQDKQDLELILYRLQEQDKSVVKLEKHFHSQFSTYRTNDVAYNTFSAGYGNTTSAVDAIQFKFAAGDIDLGTIKMYGVN